MSIPPGEKITIGMKYLAEPYPFKKLVAPGKSFTSPGVFIVFLVAQNGRMHLKAILRVLLGIIWISDCLRETSIPCFTIVHGIRSGLKLIQDLSGN